MSTGHAGNTQPVPSVSVVAAIIVRDGKYLLCLRPPTKRHGGMWEFPGGKVRVGEDLRDAVERELAEELSLITDEVGETIDTISDVGSEFLINFLTARVKGEPKSKKHPEIGWSLPAEVHALALAPADAEFVERHITYRTQ